VSQYELLEVHSLPPFLILAACVQVVVHLLGYVPEGAIGEVEGARLPGGLEDPIHELPDGSGRLVQIAIEV